MGVADEGIRATVQINTTGGARMGHECAGERAAVVTGQRS